MASLEGPDGGEALPAVDDQIAPLESRFEIMDGELIYVSPADGPHGTRHATIAALLQAHVGAGFQVAVDLLTRTSKIDDIAPDVSVLPLAPDPVTGGRQLQQLAFEVVSKQSIAYAGRKAAKLVGRGVRRVFAIDVERGRALEWSAADAAWHALDRRARIVDPALAAALPVAALLRTASADSTVARALIAKHNPAIQAVVSRARRAGKRGGLVEGKREGLVEGKRAGIAEGKRAGIAEGKRAGLAEGKRAGLAHGRREALLAILAVRGVAIAPAERAKILRERDPDRLGRWLERARTCATIAEVLAAP